MKDIDFYNMSKIYGKLSDVTDKDASIQYYINNMLCRTQSMFKYNNLPETIPFYVLELMLQTNGNVCITKIQDKLYAFTGGLGGEPNVYYIPTVYTISNPALNVSKMLKIGKDCVVIKNDSLYIGLLPMFNRYASLLAENDISMRIADINSRIIALISASDDKTKKSAEEYIKKVEQGKTGVIAENAFFEGLRTQPFAGQTSGVNLTQLIEYEQYLKASFWNEIGLNANYNMKREAINSSEAQLNNDALLPLVDELLRCRKEGIKQVNEMFGTNITVELNSAWEDNEQELEASQKVIEQPVANGTPQPSETDDNTNKEGNGNEVKKDDT